MSYLADCNNREAKSMMGLIHQIKLEKERVRNRRMSDLHETLKYCKEQRSINRFASNGWTKSRTRVSVSSIPAWLVFDKEYGKYFDPRIPFQDRRKEHNKFLKRFEKEVGNLRTTD